MGIGVLSQGVKHGRGVTLTTHHLVPRSRMRSYISSPLGASMAIVGQLFTELTVHTEATYSAES
jgi:hypothetical protein